MTSIILGVLGGITGILIGLFIGALAIVVTIGRAFKDGMSR